MSFIFHVFDVGHGDSFIIKTPHNKICIIDCHKYDGFIPTIDYIKDNNISEIEFICLTHPHLDHYSGMYDFISYCVENNILIKTFYQTGISPKAIKHKAYNQDECDEFIRFFKYILTLASDNKINYKKCETDSVLLQEDQCFIKVLAPDARVIDGINLETFDRGDTYLNESLNDLSLIMQVSAYGKNLLLLSDSPLKIQNNIIKKYPLLKNSVSVFKISHHGSLKSLSQNLIKSSKTNTNSIALISAGCRYGLPDIKTINNLSKLQIGSYATNFWDYSNVEKENDENESIDPDILCALENLTDEVEGYQKLMPYHGTITAVIDSTGINYNTEIDRAPLFI